MLVATVITLSAICGFVRSSEFHPIAPAGIAPVVTAASSQYFERTFNRLVAAPALQPAFPIASAPPVVIDAKTTITPVIPTNLPQPLPADPNIAIAIATAQAAPVATILLPPYPFGIPSSLGLIPDPSYNVPSENPNRESTTQTPTTAQTTTEKNLEVAPFPSNNDNSFAQPLPGNENVNFRQYLAPSRHPPSVRPTVQPTQRPVQQPPKPGPQQLPAPTWNQPQLPPQRPIKLKTTVEVVPVPLAYIAPPPVISHAHIQSHGHNEYDIHSKIPKHVHFHTYVPKKTKIIIRPVHSTRVPTRLVVYKPLARSSGPRYPQNALRATDPREREPTTFRPANRPMTKPPRI